MNVRNFLRFCLAVALLAPCTAVLRAQDVPPAAHSRTHVMSVRGMAGLVQSVSPSRILFTVEEHVTFTANLSTSTQVVQDGQAAGLQDIQPGGWIFVQGDFDLAAHTVSADRIRLTTPQGTRVLQRVFDNFGTT